MAGEFTSWCALYAQFKDALAKRKAEWLFKRVIENQRQMELGYNGPMNVANFMEWLSQKCGEEKYGDGIEGGMFGLTVGGDDA